MRAVFLLVFVTAISAAPAPEAEALTWFPLHVGSRWLYRITETTQTGTVTWTHEEQVTEHRRTPEGLLVVLENRDVPIRGPVPQHPHYDYLIRGNDVYKIYESHWLPGKSGIRSINPADEIPDFRFPLRTGAKWGEGDRVRTDNMYCWFVQLQRGKTYYLFYMSMPDRTDITFTRGVGIVRTAYTHHGTLEDIQSRLVRFIPSPSRPR